MGVFAFLSSGHEWSLHELRSLLLSRCWNEVCWTMGKHWNICAWMQSGLQCDNPVWFYCLGRPTPGLIRCCLPWYPFSPLGHVLAFPLRHFWVGVCSLLLLSEGLVSSKQCFCPKYFWASWCPQQCFLWLPCFPVQSVLGGNHHQPSCLLLAPPGI